MSNTTNRELDAEIASKVMGLNVIARDWCCGYTPDCGTYEAALDKDNAEGYPWYNERGPVVAVPIKHIGKDICVEDSYIQPVEFYSTDIKAAWKIVDKIGMVVDAQTNTVRISKNLAELACASTAPLAICLAALRVVAG